MKIQSMYSLFIYYHIVFDGPLFSPLYSLIINFITFIYVEFNSRT
jgi:hypothetical protein